MMVFVVIKRGERKTLEKQFFFFPAEHTTTTPLSAENLPFSLYFGGSSSTFELGGVILGEGSHWRSSITRRRSSS
jgi:hypothetical protein